MLGIRFSETLSGSLRPTEGFGEQPFSFTVTAEGRSLVKVPRAAPLDLEGTVTLGGSVENAPARGTLVIDPIRGRTLTYELFWSDTEDRPHRFHGHKHLHALRPVQSMTVLDGKVYREGLPLGDATLLFDLKDLPRFLLGTRPVLAR
jgi:hypothetical protein